MHTYIHIHIYPYFHTYICIYIYDFFDIPMFKSMLTESQQTETLTKNMRRSLVFLD